MIERFDTERMSLRPIHEHDIELMVELDSDPAVLRFINGGRPRSRAEVEDTLRRGLGHRWIANDSLTGEFVGWFGMKPSDVHPAVRYLGYRLRRVAWGKGLATEGSQALIALTFLHTGAERVLAQTMTVNLASRRVMEHCGLRYLRTFFEEWDEPIEGSELGDVEYALTRADWQRGQA